MLFTYLPFKISLIQLKIINTKITVKKRFQFYLYKFLFKYKLIMIYVLNTYKHRLFEIYIYM